MVEQGTRVDQLVSIDVSERFEALQDEVDLLKNEIKQTLVDLREHMMKDRTVFSQAEAEPQRRAPSPLPPRVVYTKEPPTPEAMAHVKGRPSLQHFALGAQTDGMDPVMLGNVICWLGTVKQMGLSLQQVTPFLEAYEASGYLHPIMLKVLLRSLADLDQLAESPSEEDFSPEHYAECLGQLHDIICAANIVQELPLPAPELQEGYPEASLESFPETDAETYIEAEAVDGKPHTDQANEYGANDQWNNYHRDNGRYGSEESPTDKYKLTSIQVPDSQDYPERPETNNLNG